MNYREEIKKILDAITKESLLHFLYIIIADIALSQGIIDKVDYGE